MTQWAYWSKIVTIFKYYTRLDPIKSLVKLIVPNLTKKDGLPRLLAQTRNDGGRANKHRFFTCGSENDNGGTEIVTLAAIPSLRSGLASSR
jgi:hypothetical protein